MEAYDGAGAVLVSVTDRIGRVVGIVAGASGGGTVSHPSLSQGTPFAFAQVAQGITLASTTPQCTINGTTITYTGSALPFRIIFGTY
jgi:hypothetical protein